MAVGVLAVGVAGVAVFFGAGPGGSQPEPLRPPTPTPSLTSDINGWPTTVRNPPGVYSLDNKMCGGTSKGYTCIVGWMHNGYGSGDVDISISVGSDVVILDDGGTPVSIAGHDGTYRQITPHQEDWTADIDGTPIAINLAAAPGTSQADLAEAHAIIDSMRTEPTDNVLNDSGFKLVFTLTTNNWDSG